MAANSAMILACVVAALMILIPTMAPIGITTAQARPYREDEIEFHLNRLNKPAVKSIMIDDGEIIDCVDIYKQPAFDHPLLKDHEIIMYPSFDPKLGKKFDQRHILQPKWAVGDGCPDGTIPIRRVQKSDLMRAPSPESFGRLHVNHSDLIERAGVFSDSGPFNGIRADVEVWPVTVRKDEWTRANVELNDIDRKIIIEAGWMANPILFGDARPRIYAYWTLDRYQETGCFNLLCPGFIQVAKNYALGNAPEPLSIYDVSVSTISTTINKDDVNQLWWLIIQGEPVGYWPMSMFVQHGDFFKATYLDCGGAVLNKWKLNGNGTHRTTTTMGSGHFAEERRFKAAAIANLDAIGENNRIYDSPYNLVRYADRSSCYNVDFDEDPRSTSSIKFIFYGGPGGHEC